MSRFLAAAGSVALGLCLAADASPAFQTSIPVNAGDRVYGDLDGSADRDDFALPVPEGALLTVSVKALGKGSPLLPTLDLWFPDGTSILLSSIITGEGTASVSLPGVRASQTGDHVLGIRGFTGTSGAYLATFGVLFDPPPKGEFAVPAGQTVLVEFSAFDGSLVSFVAGEKAGGPLASVSLVAPDGSAVEASEGVRKGSKVSARKVPLASGHGRYAVALAGGAADATVDLKVTVKSPKASKRKLRLGPEPRPTGISPNIGPDGTTFSVQGAGFTGESRVFFAGEFEAEDVSLGQDGKLTGTCPRYAGSDAGEEAVVTVLSPDGQWGNVPQRFRYIGRPNPLAVLPDLSPLEGGVAVTVVGSRFRPGLTVTFGGVPATTVTVLNAGAVSCTTPPHASGDVTVQVVDEFGRVQAVPDPFHYADPPSVTFVSPDTLPSFGGRTLTVTGQELLPGDRVFLGGVEATGVAVLSRTSLQFTAPGAPSGAADLEVRDALGRSDTLAGAVLLTPSFQDASSASLPEFPDGTEIPGASLALGDFNGDGNPDIAVATGAARTNAQTGQKDPASRFLLNDGSGAFTDVTTTKFSVFRGSKDQGQADAMSIGDLDGDGISEVLLSRTTPLRSATQNVSYYGYPLWYVITPPDNFDWPTLPATLLLADAGSGGAFEDATASRLADPTGSSTPFQGWGERWQAAASALGDLDGNGTEDLLITAGGRLDRGYSTYTHWYFKKVYYYYYYYYYYVVDKITVEQGSYRIGSTRVLLNDGSGSLAYPASGPAPLTGSDASLLDDFSAAACAAGDLDGDGFEDAVLLSASATRKETSPGTFASAPALRVLTSYYGTLYFQSGAVPAPYEESHAGSGDFWQGRALALGDLDADGDLDILVGRDRFNYWTDGGGQVHLLPAIRIFRNDGSGGFTEDTGSFLPDGAFRAGSASTLLGVRAFALADVDGDGDPDLLLTGRETTVANAGGGLGPRGILPAGTKTALRVFLNDGSGHFTDATDERVPPASAGSHFQGDALATADLDGDGLLDIVLAMDVAPADGTGPLRVLLSK